MGKFLTVAVSAWVLIFTIAVGSDLSRRKPASVTGTPIYPDQIQLRSGTFAIVGDPQRTLALESLIGREQNDEEREFLFREIARARPDFLAMTGDLVSYSTDTNWAYFDGFMKPLLEAGVSVLPALGNHDVWSSLDAAFERFPVLKGSRWYSRVYSGLKLIWIDTNYSVWTPEEWHAQLAFVRSELEEADHNPGIRGALVLGHHPPFTNSKTTGDENYMQADFVPLLLRSRKFLAYISGHAHGYEHFLEDSRHFIVSGGGGGPRVSYLSGGDQRHPDLFQGPSPRPFHFIEGSLASGVLRFTVRGLQKGDQSLSVIDGFEVPLRPN